jgi:hypothetical protein
MGLLYKEVALLLVEEEAGMGEEALEIVGLSLTEEVEVTDTLIQHMFQTALL